jgi:hypothetical protein
MNHYSREMESCKQRNQTWIAKRDKKNFKSNILWLCLRLSTASFSSSPIPSPLEAAAVPSNK